MGPEITTWVLILLIALLNLAIYSGVVRGEDAINTLDAQAETPAAKALKAEQNDSTDLPGEFVPTQGRQHVADGTVVEFCAGGQRADGCYASNPPSSGLHMGVMGDYVLADGSTVDIPPPPGVYDVALPRESIPHMLEHAGVYVGYNCLSQACQDAARRLTDLVAQQVDAGKRVVLAPSPDLAVDTFGMSAWTRVFVLGATEYNDSLILGFIDAHSCRFDPEGFCE